MNILKVKYNEQKDASDPQTFELHTVDLSVDEFAQLRFLLDMCGILDGKIENHEPTEGEQKISITLETMDDEREACFTGELPPEVEELVECLKDLRYSHPLLSTTTH